MYWFGTDGRGFPTCGVWKDGRMHLTMVLCHKELALHSNSEELKGASSIKPMQGNGNGKVRAEKSPRLFFTLDHTDPK